MIELGTLLDFETLLDALWTRDLADVPVASEFDTAFIDELPAIRYSLGGVGQDGNGPGLFDVTLTWNVYGPPAAAWDVMSRSYGVVHRWPIGAPISGVGWVQKATDVGVPSKTPQSDLDGKGNTQYAASVALVLRN